MNDDNPPQDQAGDLPKTEDLSRQMQILKTQLQRTREINTSLWAKVNHGVLSQDEDGNSVVNDETAQLVWLKAENVELAKQISDIETRYADQVQTNSELWKRVHYAEARAGVSLRRRAGKILRKIGMLRR